MIFALGSTETEKQKSQNWMLTLTVEMEAPIIGREIEMPLCRAFLVVFLLLSQASSASASDRAKSVARQIDLPLSFFGMPVGCKETKRPDDVMNSGVMDVVRDMTGF